MQLTPKYETKQSIISNIRGSSQNFFTNLINLNWAPFVAMKTPKRRSVSSQATRSMSDVSIAAEIFLARDVITGFLCAGNVFRIPPYK
jgi:hypothetical protein